MLFLISKIINIGGEKGEYRLTYAFGTKVSFTGDPVDAIYKQMFRLEIQIILEGLVGKIKKEINQ